jgi:hypothetical protein
MSTTFRRAFVLISLVLPLLAQASDAKAQAGVVLADGKLSPGFDMGVNSSEARTDWLRTGTEQLQMSYPAGQTWGAVFVTVGKPKPLPGRPYRDMSAFDTVSVDLKGISGGETLEFGIKTNTQPDDGSEMKVPLTLTSDWKTFVFPLGNFVGAAPDRLYVVAEFVFSGGRAETVNVRNVKYLSSAPAGAASDTSPSGTAPVQAPLQARPATIPGISITSPSPKGCLTDVIDVSVRSHQRPSIIVHGTVSDLSNDLLLYLVVHPISSDLSWASPIPPPVDVQWSGQAWFGDFDYLPVDNAEFQLFAVAQDRRAPLADTFVAGTTRLNHISDILKIRTKVVTPWDRLATFAKDVSLSGPLAAVIALIGAGIGAIFERRRSGKGTKGATASNKQ